MMLKGITGKFLAKKAGVSETWISLVINGRGTSARIRKVIADAVGMNVEDLWENNGKRAA